MYFLNWFPALIFFFFEMLFKFRTIIILSIDDEPLEHITIGIF